MSLRHVITAALACLWLGMASAAVEANKATEAELDGVRGLGPSLTARIIAAREKAPFRNWDEFILRVPGIGPARAYQLSAEGLTVNGESYQIQGVATPPGVPAIPKAPAAPAAPPKPAMPKFQ